MGLGLKRIGVGVAEFEIILRFPHFLQSCLGCGHGFAPDGALRFEERRLIFFQQLLSLVFR
jgi:hypothetical protein